MTIFRISRTVADDFGTEKLEHVNLIDPNSGIMRCEFKVGRVGMEQVTTRSVLNAQSRLRQYAHNHTIGTLVFHERSSIPDQLISTDEKFIEAMYAALDHWAGASPYPVWIELRPRNYSKSQYYTIQNWKTDTEIDLTSSPFMGDHNFVIENQTFALELSAPSSVPPLSPESVAIASYTSYNTGLLQVETGDYLLVEQFVDPTGGLVLSADSGYYGNTNVLGEVLATTDGTAYVGNAQTAAQSNRQFRHGTDDLISEALPYPVVGNGFVADDEATYFGSQSSQIGHGYMNSLVFNLSQGASGWFAAWEYLSSTSGNWEAIPEQSDNTAQFFGQPLSKTGVSSFHWHWPQDAASTVVNGISTTYIRLRCVTANGSASPIQQNQHIYSISHAFVEAESDQFKGDIPAQVQLDVLGQSSADFLSPEELRWHGVIIGRRSLWRGPNFNPYIPLGGQMEPANTSVTALSGVDASQQVTSVSAGANPYGAAGIWSPQSTYPDMTDLFQVSINRQAARQMVGDFKVFLRFNVVQNPNALDNLRFRLRYNFPSNSDGVTSPLYIGASNGHTLLTDEVVLADMGTIKFGTGNTLTGDTGAGVVYIQGQLIDGATLPIISMHDLIFIPTDEWYASAITTNVNGETVNGYELRIGSQYDPSLGVAAVQYQIDPGDYVGQYVYDGREPLANVRTKQRWWFMFVRRDRASGFITSPFGAAASVRMSKTERYSYARGNR